MKNKILIYYNIIVCNKWLLSLLFINAKKMILGKTTTRLIKI